MLIRKALLCAIFCIPTTVFAQPVQSSSDRHPTPQINLLEAIRRASKHHPRVLSVQHRVEGARLYRLGAGSQSPLQLRLGDTIGNPADEVNAITQQLEISGQTTLRGKAAEYDLQRLEASLRQEQRLVARESAAAYLGQWEAEMKLKVHQIRLDLSKSLETSSKRRLELGDIAFNQHLRVKMESTRAQVELETALGQLHQAESRFSASLGLPAQSKQLLADSMDLQSPRAPKLNLAANPVIENLEQRSNASPILESQRKNVQIAEVQTKLAELERAPSLNLMLYRSRLYGAIPGTTPAVQLTLSWPIWDWGTIQAEIDKKKAEHLALQSELDQQTLQVGLELQQAYQQWRAAAAKRELLGSQLQDALGLAELARRGYDSGYASLLEVLDAQRNYRDVLLDFLSAETSTALARLDLEWASGGPAVHQEGDATHSQSLPLDKIEGLKP
jgi:cobalt-zinc-cadmium efflux system outer membrane protein